MRTGAVFVAGLLLGALGLWVLLGNPPVPAPVPAPLPMPTQAGESVEPVDTVPPAAAPSPIDAPVETSVEMPSGAVPPAESPSPVPAGDTRPAPPASAPPMPSRPLDLLVPVQGVMAAQLSDTFADARSDERVHDAIDIMAPTGTPVLAVEDGRIVRFFDSERGGLTIYQFDANDELAYYYAHLDRRAEGLVEGQAVQRGDVIGYVGYSGNASPEAPHLHFAIFVLGPEKNWWRGTAINPYPLLVKR